METKSRLKISALQLNSITANKQANFEKVYELINRDFVQGTDILVLPEVWTVGWACEHFSESAESLEDNGVISFLSKLATKFHTNIIGGSFIRKDDNGNLYNSCPVIDRKGNLIGIYDKNHLYSYAESNEGRYVNAGENALVVTLDGIKVGITICYDIRFPEIYREYRKKGVQLFVNCAAWGSPKPIPWEILTRARAIENQAYMVAVTQSGPIDLVNWNLGHSRIINYLGEVVAEIKDQKEGLMSCEISFDEMEKYRKEFTILNDIKDKYEVISK